MSKRARRRQRPSLPAQANPRTAQPAERVLLDQIAQGALDCHLPALADAIHARLELLETIDSAKALALLNVGDHVRFNHHTKPQYLRGVRGVVIELEERTATVCVHEPIGRFRSGEIHRCPPLLLERLYPAAAGSAPARET